MFNEPLNSSQEQYSPGDLLQRIKEISRGPKSKVHQMEATGCCLRQPGKFAIFSMDLNIILVFLKKKKSSIKNCLLKNYIRS
jgi:hypothetical protein